MFRKAITPRRIVFSIGMLVAFVFTFYARPDAVVSAGGEWCIHWSAPVDVRVCNFDTETFNQPLIRAFGN